MQHLLKLIVAIQLRVADISDREQERGATATEYALLVAFIAIAIMFAVTALGGALGAFFDRLSTKVGTMAP